MSCLKQTKRIIQLPAMGSNMTTQTNQKVFLVEQVDGAMIVTPQGDGVGFRYNEIHIETNALVDEMRRQGATRLLIDFSGVEIIGSIMISSVIKMARQIASHKGQAAFCSASDTMFEVMNSMNLTRLWPYHETREKGLASMAKPE